MSDIKSSRDVARHRVTADEAEAGQRLDRVLASRLGDLSRARIQQLLGEGRVTRDGVTIKDANHRVKGGETFEIAVPSAVTAKPLAQNIPLDVVYEDKDLIVIQKPAGLVVHPAAGNPDGTLVNALIAHCGASLMGIGGEARPGIVHRLDKDTSGLLVAAKTERAMASLAKQFANHTIERAYHALVWGAPRAGEGVIEGQIGAAAIRLQGVRIAGIGEVPVQLIQALPYALTVLLLAGFIGKAVAPKASGIPYVKER